MAGAAPSFAGVMGYRRSRWNSLRMQGRVAIVRDGVLTVVDRKGEEVERVLLGGAGVELKRGMLQVVAGDRRFYLFGYAQMNKLPDELIIRAAEEQPDEVLDYEPARVFRGPFDQSRALYEALRAHGAHELRA